MTSDTNKGWTLVERVRGIRDFQYNGTGVIILYPDGYYATYAAVAGSAAARIEEPHDPDEELMLRIPLDEGV